MKTLTFSETGIPPDEVRKIVRLEVSGGTSPPSPFFYPVSTVPMLMPFVLSLPNLRDLMIGCVVREEPQGPFIPPDETWRGEPLQSLDLFLLSSGPIEFIALCGVTSRRVDLSVGDMMEKVIVCSSETMRELVLQDALSRCEPSGSIRPPNRRR